MMTVPVDELGPLGAGIYSHRVDSLGWQVNALQVMALKNKSLFITFWLLFLMMGLVIFLGSFVLTWMGIILGNWILYWVRYKSYVSLSDLLQM